MTTENATAHERNFIVIEKYGKQLTAFSVELITEDKIHEWITQCHTA